MKKVFRMWLCYGVMHSPMNAQFGHAVCGLLDGGNYRRSIPEAGSNGWLGSRLDFTPEGGNAFAELTGKIAEMTDLATGMPGRLAIVLDGQLESAPTVKERIGGGSAVITGNFSFREAKMLSDILNNPLKVSLTIGEQYEVSPTVPRVLYRAVLTPASLVLFSLSHL